jgi:4-aminobutyrate aminotransferase-like enzyme
MRARGDPGHEALHTATFFGHPVCAAAALATLDVLEQEHLGHRAQATGLYLVEQLHALRAQAADIIAVRGAGLLIGIELRSGARALAVGRRLLELGYITVPAASDARVISLTPPLTIHARQVDGFVRALGSVLAEQP